MTGLWEALSNPETREVLAWLGGGVCVVVSGLWAAYLKLGLQAAAGPAPTAGTTASADRGGIAAGRSRTSSIASGRIPAGVWVLGAAGLARPRRRGAADRRRHPRLLRQGRRMENSRIEIRGAEC